MGQRIVFYRRRDGRCPVEEFLNSLPSKDAQKVAWVSIFAFFDYIGNLILTHGYSKKSLKTDPRQIRQAEIYRRDHLERKGELS